jgi:hypothetical protein
MNFLEGLHIVIDCKLNNKELLEQTDNGLKLINLIIQKLKLNLLMPLILVDFPHYQNFNGIKPFEQQEITNNLKYIQTDCFSKLQNNEDNKLGGYSIFGIIAESHISMHTFPEDNYFSFDLYSCKKFDTNFLIDLLNKELKDCQLNYKIVKRG